MIEQTFTSDPIAQKDYDGPYAKINGVQTPLPLALKELSHTMLTLERIKASVQALQDAIAPTILEIGGTEDEDIIAKVTKGREKTDHETAILYHVANSHTTNQEMLGTIAAHSTIAWAKVSKALGVPKATLGKYTAMPQAPKVTFKLKEAE